ncbi:hypothetical protein LQ567_04135 [Niabella pedocola]|uniref:Lipoprotein n=1 Tax=Niabella pedocola TaxID=1752077 RepID=A0ABS8PNR1_9BACT|nr:hypothetical protein [Niabella pedocola]MCD2421937.1 hypothetical protein [Niabella pedocola]
MKTAIVLGGICILTGCDPVQVMNIQATGKKNTSVVLYGNKSLTGTAAAADTGKILIRVPQGDITSRRLYFERGGWSDADLDTLIRDIDSVTITNQQGTERLNDKNALKAYLQAHRSGFARNELTLEAKQGYKECWWFMRVVKTYRKRGAILSYSCGLKCESRWYRDKGYGANG